MRFLASLRIYLIKSAKRSRLNFIKRYKHRTRRDLDFHCCWYYTSTIASMAHSLKVFASQAEGWVSRVLGDDHYKRMSHATVGIHVTH